MLGSSAEATRTWKDHCKEKGRKGMDCKDGIRIGTVGGPFEHRRLSEHLNSTRGGGGGNS
jgi:hypothetical protein